MAVVLLLAAAAPARAQWPNTDDIQALAAWYEREWLQPVLDGLAVSARRDQSLQALLRNVRLWIAGPRLHTGPNAGADRAPDGTPLVYVDFLFLSEISWLANLAGLSLTKTDEAAPVLQQAGAAYVEDLGRGAASGEPLPAAWVFDLGDHALPAGVRAMAEHLSLEVNLSSIAWVLFHEFAHHRLGHLDSTEVTYAASRRMELEADEWAFDRMYELGYHLYPTRELLQIMELRDEARFLAGYGVPEEVSTHPRFSRRRQLLEARYPNLLARSEWIVIGMMAQVGPNRYAMEETWIPRRPDITGNVFAFFRGADDEFAVQGLTMRDGVPHVYGRDAERLTEVVVHEPDAIYPRITIRETRLGTGETIEEQTRGIQLDFGWSQELEIDVGSGPQPIRDVLALSSQSLFVGRLRRVTSSTTQQRDGAAAHLAMLRDVGEILAAYAREELSFDQASRRMTARAEEGQRQLRVLLGSEAFTRLRDVTLGDDLTNWAFDRLLQQGGIPR